MSNMIERVARAVYAENGWLRIVAENDDGKGRYETKAGSRWRAVEFDELDADERDSRLREARAAIEAMREPTEAMTNAAYVGAYEPGDMAPFETWPKMIDAALKEGA